MPLTVTKLKECPQELWLGDLGYSSEGICYYMSEYVHQTVWGLTVRSFAKAVDVATKVIPASIVKAGKAKNMLDRGGDRVGREQETYTHTGALSGRSLYRVGLWFGDNTEVPDDAQDQNHEAVVLTSTIAAHAVVLFEPNFGFYQAVDNSATMKVIFEAAVRGLYAPDDHAENFTYKLVRTVR